MNLSTRLQHFALGISISTCSFPLEPEQMSRDAGMAENRPAPPANQPGEEENCYTTGCPLTYCTLYDDYAGSELDACKWKVREGSPYLQNGYLRLAQSAIESAPETTLKTTPNSDLLCPTLSTEFKVRQAGTGYAELHLKLDDIIAVYAHPLGDLNKRWLSIACLSNGESSPLTPFDMSEWSTLRVEVDAEQDAEKASEARLYRNGELVGSVSCPRPVHGRKIDVQAFGELAMEIDYVQQWWGE